MQYYVKFVIKFCEASAFFFACILELFASECLSSLFLPSSFYFSEVIFGENILGVERILSKCWNYCLAFCLSWSVTRVPFISTTLGNRYTMNVLQSYVCDTSLFSIDRCVRVVKISSFDIWMKLWMLLSEKRSFLSLTNFRSLPRLEWEAMLSNLTYWKQIYSTDFWNSALLRTSRALPYIKRSVSPSISACPDYTRHSFLDSFLRLYPLSPIAFILSISFCHSYEITLRRPSGDISSLLPFWISEAPVGDMCLSGVGSVEAPDSTLSSLPGVIAFSFSPFPTTDEESLISGVIFFKSRCFKLGHVDRQNSK